MVLCIYEICLKLELCCGTICIQTPYIYYAWSKLILFNTHNKCLGLYGILPTHRGSESVKVNYYGCMM